MVFEPKIIYRESKPFIWDSFRKKYVSLTPEEMVRQELLFTLTTQHKYPKACIAVEKVVATTAGKKRFDVLVYKDAVPFLLAECKAPHIAITENTFMQSMVYQHCLSAKYILLCNGIQLMCMNTIEKKWLENFPSY